MRVVRLVRAAWLLAALVVCAAPAVTGAAGAVVSGTVSGSDVGFLTDASVVLDGPAHHEGRTDADGRFTLRDVAPGRYRVRAAADGYLPVENTMDVGTASVSVDIMLLRLPGL